MIELTTPSSARAPRSAAETGRWLAFAVTALGAFMASLDLSIVNVAFPALEHAFPHDGRAALAWVITGYGIAFGALLVTSGRIADRWGRRRTFFLGLCVFGVGSALCGIAPTLAALVAGRLVEGVGAAALVPSSLGLLLDAFPAERRSHAVALWGGVGALAVATGPTLGAILVSGAGWRWVFFVNLPVALLAWLAGRRILRESASGTAGARSDYLGAVLTVVPLAALVLAISEGPAWGWSSLRVLGLFAIAVGAGAAFLRRAARHPEPALDLSLFRIRSFSVANAITLLYAMGFYAMFLGNVLYLTSVWHYPILDAGLAITPSPILVALASGPAGRLATRIGFRPVLLLGTAVFAAGLALYAGLAALQPDYLTRWLPASLLVGIGIGLTFPVLGAAAVSDVPSPRFAVASAVNQTARQVGGALGVALLVVILGSPGSPVAGLAAFRHMWLYAAAMAVAAGLASRLLAGRRPSLRRAA